MTAEEERLNRLHTGGSMKLNPEYLLRIAHEILIDHCIEIMRQATLCRADVSLFTLQWSQGSLRPQADISQAHECVNFDLINKWASKRRVDASKAGILTHPIYGKLPIDFSTLISLDVAKHNH